MKEYKYKINGTTYHVAVGDIENNIAQVEVNGTAYSVELNQAQPINIVKAPRPAAAPRTETGEKVISKPTTAPAVGTQIKAPLPGTVLAINAKVGDVVKSGDTVLTLEAMKMENAIHAGKDGKLTAILVNQGDAVLEGAPLFVIE